jgi:hypothetical protein
MHQASGDIMEVLAGWRRWRERNGDAFEEGERSAYHASEAFADAFLHFIEELCADGQRFRIRS